MKRIAILQGNVRAQNPGKMAAQTAKPALQPIAAMHDQQMRNLFHNAGAVRPHKRENDHHAPLIQSANEEI